MGKPLRVLIVEDSEDDAALLVRELERGGYDPTFERVDTAQGMSDALARGPWDVIICDYNLPHFSAPAALMLAQKSGLDLPFVVVSGSIGEDVAVAAMKSGAHDYVMKGNLKRLVPAVERELREAKVRTECKQVEEAIRVSEEKFRAVAETANDAIVSADGHGNIMYFNKGAERIFGCPEAEVVGKPLTLLMPERFHDAHRQGINRFLSTGKAHVIGKTVELAGKRKDGTEFPMELSLATWKTGEEIFFAGILRDITERKQAEETIKYQAMYDALTGLPNRNMLYDRLCRALLDAQRENKSAALMLMDIDQFKEINDTLGHDRGDLLLKQIGPRLKSALHEGDLIARMGGDEFSVLLPLAESRHAVQVGNKIMRALEPPIEVE
ncbi:MAG: diguanylate cyclase, partial [Nitrospirae bacterium]|nr:diguanylate cyclase [Nitrospirota bacterium]